MTQQLVMTPQLQQAIKLLALSHLEVVEVLRDEIVQNPMLEEQGEHVEDGPHVAHGEDGGERGRAAGDDGAERIISEAAPQVGELGQDGPGRAEDAWAYDPLALHVPSANPPGREAAGGRQLTWDATLRARTSLLDHMRWQVQMGHFADGERPVANMLLAHLDDNGYVGEDAVAQVAAACGGDIADVEAVLLALQEFDPPGVAARNLRECLLVQAHRALREDTLSHRIIDEFLPQVAKRDLAAIARVTQASIPEVQAAIRRITQLEPRPGLCFTHDQQPVSYITPDIFVTRVGPGPGQFAVTLNEDGLPQLRISPYYRHRIAQGLEGEAKMYVQEKLRSASWLIRSIHMRQKTIYRVMQSIVKFQAAFFEGGVCYLKPLILKDIAEDVKMHESTISRVTSNKYVHTPQGIYELKFFFNSSIRSIDGDNVASESVRSHIERLISHENPKSPHSDQRLVEALRTHEIHIARRTVAKYREMLKIPASSRRRRVF